MRFVIPSTLLSSRLQSIGKVIVSKNTIPILDNFFDHEIGRNDKIDDKILESEVQSAPRSVFSKTKVQQDVQRILEVYKRAGRYGVSVEPKIIKKSGAIIEDEGCLSFPEAYTAVRRYKNVTVKALDINGRPFILEATDGCLLARAIQHEYDHLDGILFIDHCVNRFETDSILQKHHLPPIEEDKLLIEPDLEEELEND